ncbi:M60 family metallopeptidase [Peptacetobacter hiranonis]|uniref:Fibronectin type III domain protein n=1 Tax=Peptacetobacter hiranonis (strain DSM 13275 / JCM 10541 / KCTC 15199 / TO-931) TaxID=500633 RepID=B6FXD4_PEPHT|nr:M60 family metallopeptidase [Peptacetobacter hiranonis]EEA85817.1 fibronectin type III domain protein [Peptacetobacter hiranonis DSM 13275]QEK20568.1 hypothetical protein KGNDJEFE_01051 [Peptacetobacter hiranonis]
MKKVISGALAAAIITSNLPLRVLAEEMDIPDANQNDQSINQEKTRTGYIEVEIKLDMPIMYSDDAKIKVDLSESGEKTLLSAKLGESGNFEDNNGHSYSVEALGYKGVEEVKDGGKVYVYKVRFNNLTAAKGKNYNININGNGFRGIASDIELNEFSKKVVVNNLYNSDSANMLFGNINKDNVVDDRDYETIFNHIGTSEEEYDLNRDGKVDITDLTYVHKNLNKKASETLKTENMVQTIDVEKIELEKSENSIVTGSVNDLLTGSNNGLKISKEKGTDSTKPLEVSLNLTGSKNKPTDTPQYVEMQTIVIKGGEVAPTEGTVVVTDSNGNEEIYKFGENTSKPEGKSFNLLRTENNDTTTDNNKKENKNIVINLNNKVAVAKITIKITNTTEGDRKLANIAKVEFINDVYKEEQKPDMNIPKVNKVETSTATGSEHMTLYWNKENNITGYEIKIEEINASGEVQGNAKVFRTSENFFKYSAVKAYRRYRVSIQSVNGEWESGYNAVKDDEKNGVIDNIDPATMGTNGKDATYSPKDVTDDNGIVNIMVVPNSKPEPPEGINIISGYKSLDINWKAHSSAQSFDVYYKKIDSEEGNSTKDEVIPGLEGFTKANKNPITNTTQFILSDLEDNASYEIKLTATNHLGTSGATKSHIGTTIDISIPVSPNYNLINTPNGYNELTNNIESVEFPTLSDDKLTNGDISITDKDCVVDNDYTTAWSLTDWDSGASYKNNKRGPIVTFKEEYKINRIAIISRLDAFASTPNKAVVNVWDYKNDKWIEYDANVQNINNNGYYTLIDLPEAVNARRIQVNLSTSPRRLSISEMKFYQYDDIETSVENLFEDDLKVELRKNKENGKVEVTQEEIDQIRKTLKTPNEEGEYNPRKDTLLNEVKLAETILKDNKLSEKVISVDPLINGSGANTGYNNTWQALGYSVKAGQKIDVYMGRNENKKVVLAYEQHYGESGSYLSKEIELKPGRNTISIEKLDNFDLNYEKGGNLYVRVTDNVDSSNAEIKVRVSGATEIPHLDLNNHLEDVDYLVNNPNSKEALEIKEKLKAYIESLKAHVQTMQSKYPESATKSDNTKNIYTYDKDTSVLNSTNIEGDRFTLTLPAQDVYEGITEGAENNLDKQVENLYNTVLAWEQIIQITNAKKGVFEKVADFNNDGQINADDANSKDYQNNKASKRRVNVKYQRMFIGAFMYASGHHVGIDVGSSKDLMKGVPFKFDENGYVTNPDEARLFGWGISHEIGHKADIGNRTYSETSNNILALITQTFDGKDKSRLEENGIYPKIYKKVTSSSVGVSQDATTLLGMFWQLQLAYEPGYTSEMLKRNNDGNLTNDSYYAKMNRLYRSLTDAEKALDKDQLLIRKASESAGKDLTDFFESWGLVADSKTKAALTGLEKETKKIQYLNDEAYRKRLANDSSDLNMSKDLKVNASFEDVETGAKIESGSIVNNNSIKINIDLPDEFKGDKDKILGYEIIRSDGNTLTEVKDESTNPTTSDKKYKTEILYRPVGFVNAEDGKATFTDDISPINNRAMTYKVVAYDYNLNATAEFTIGSIKMSHDGKIDSSNFVLKSNLKSGTTSSNTKNENTVEDKGIDAIKDKDVNTSFKGEKITSEEYEKNPHKQEGIDVNADPYVIMDLQGSKAITGLKYTKSSDAVSKLSLKRLINAVKGETSYSSISKYEISISDDGETWKVVSEPEATFEFGQKTVLGGQDDKNTATVIFKEDGNLCTYEARYVKLVAKDATNVDIAEVSLLGTTGDNIEIGAVNETDNTLTNGIGKLEEDVQFESGEKIPKGSIIVTGEYKGNPAFNVPLLIDDDNKTIEGTFLLMANVPENAPLGEVDSGTWIYYTEPENFDKLSSSVKAELYRYNYLDKTGSPQGQRLVSDTLYKKLPGSYNDLDNITFSNIGTVSRTKSPKVVKSINTKDYNLKEDK